MTTECGQLREANRAWQRYEQTQLDNIRHKLEDYIPMDEHISFDDVLQKVIERINKDREILKKTCAELDTANNRLLSGSLTQIMNFYIYIVYIGATTDSSSVEQSLIDSTNDLRDEVLILKNQNEELERMNKHLLIEKEDLNNQLNDRSLVLGHHSVSDLAQIQEETSEDVGEVSFMFFFLVYEDNSCYFARII